VILQLAVADALEVLMTYLHHYRRSMFGAAEDLAFLPKDFVWSIAQNATQKGA
jgi:hypothetical protein